MAAKYSAKYNDRHGIVTIAMELATPQVLAVGITSSENNVRLRSMGHAAPSRRWNRRLLATVRYGRET
jgi:hypothetical protein